MADLELTLSSPKNQYSHGEALTLHYEAKNVSGMSLFVVKEKVYGVREAADTLRVVVGQIKPAIDIRYYSFEAPSIEELPAGKSLSSNLKVVMPLQDGEVGPDGIYHLKEVPLSGSVSVYLDLGYGSTRFQPRTTDPLGEFLAWQNLASSNRITIQIAAP